MQSDIERVLITQQNIAKRVRELAEQITADHSPPHVASGEVTIVPIMTGAMIFCGDLIRQIPIAMKIGLVTVSSYPGASLMTNGAQLLSEQIGDVCDRHVVLVDDILDSGGTIRLVVPMLMALGAESVKTCVLLRKDRPSARNVKVDYMGFEIPDEFVVGYGLDYNDYYRNLPDIVTLNAGDCQDEVKMPEETNRREIVLPVEGAAAAPVHGYSTSLATLLASHILRDGEVVLLILKPSFWFIIFNSTFFSAVVLVACIALAVHDHRTHDNLYFEIALFLITGRVMWSSLQWMGRLYVLTDLRVLRVNGVFNIDVFDCPLRKVVRTRIVSTTREKVVRVGSIEIIPRDESMPAGIWQTVAKPASVHEKIMNAINRARQSGMGIE